MSRFYIGMKDAPKVRIEFSIDLKETIKPQMIDLFGLKLIQNETYKDGLLIYEFEANAQEQEMLMDLLKIIESQHVVKSIDIDMNLN